MQVRTGVEPAEALMALVPEAYRNHPDLVKTYPEVRQAWLSTISSTSDQTPLLR